MREAEEEVLEKPPVGASPVGLLDLELPRGVTRACRHGWEEEAG